MVLFISKIGFTAYRLPLTAYRLPLTAYRLPLSIILTSVIHMLLS
ncbi:alpha/beta hydrolase [Pseudoalteromonas sp. S4389]|nr:alpha/beta hydrolase [Pseudoalteromonas sp. S4389]